VNPCQDLVISVGDTRNFMLHCLFLENAKIYGVYRFSIPKSAITKERIRKSVETSGEQNFVVDLSLVQMFEEINAEKEFLNKINVDLVYPNDESSQIPIASINDVHSVDPMFLLALQSCLPPEEVRRIMKARQKLYIAKRARDIEYFDTGTSKA
jgi:hypothetical protein